MVVCSKKEKKIGVSFDTGKHIARIARERLKVVTPRRRHHRNPRDPWEIPGMPRRGKASRYIRDDYALLILIIRSIGILIIYLFVRFAICSAFFSIVRNQLEYHRIIIIRMRIIRQSFSRDPLPFRESKIVERIEISTLEGNVAIARQDWRDQGLVNPIPTPSC